MADWFETKCPQCGILRHFSKWEVGYQEFGNLECEDCGCIYNDRSKSIVKRGDIKNVRKKENEIRYRTKS